MCAVQMIQEHEKIISLKQIEKLSERIYQQE